MQANDGSSPGGRAALLRLSMDLKLHPSIIAAALEYAFDYQHAFPSASQALCFGIIRQGHCVNMQILDVALQKLNKNFGGIFDAPAVQQFFVGQWLAQPSTQSRTQLQRSVRASSSFDNAMGRPAASFTPSAALIASWSVPQRRRSNLLPKAPSSSTSALSGDDYNLSSMV